jgi:hypothetical protein
VPFTELFRHTTYTYIELLIKPEILTSYIYIYGPSFGNAEIRLFLFAAQCFNTESMQKGYPNYRWDLIRYVKGLNLTMRPGPLAVRDTWLDFLATKVDEDTTSVDMRSEGRCLFRLRMQFGILEHCVKNLGSKFTRWYTVITSDLPSVRPDEIKHHIVVET